MTDTAPVYPQRTRLRVLWQIMVRSGSAATVTAITLLATNCDDPYRPRDLYGYPDVQGRYEGSASVTQVRDDTILAVQDCGADIGLTQTESRPADVEMHVYVWSADEPSLCSVLLVGGDGALTREGILEVPRDAPRVPAQDEEFPLGISSCTWEGPTSGAADGSFLDLAFEARCDDGSMLAGTYSGRKWQPE